MRVHVCTITHMIRYGAHEERRPEDTSRKSDLSYHVSSRDQTQVSRSGSDHLYPLSPSSVCACAHVYPRLCTFRGQRRPLGSSLSLPTISLCLELGQKPASLAGLLSPLPTALELQAHMHYTPFFSVLGTFFLCSVNACAEDVLTH